MDELLVGVDPHRHAVFSAPLLHADKTAIGLSHLAPVQDTIPGLEPARVTVVAGCYTLAVGWAADHIAVDTAIPRGIGVGEWRCGEQADSECECCECLSHSYDVSPERDKCQWL